MPEPGLHTPADDTQYMAAVRAMAEDFQPNMPLGRIIGFFGAWGSGKTSFLECVRNAIFKANETGRKVHLDFFDAWQHQGTSNLVLSVFTHLLSAKEMRKLGQTNNNEKFWNVMVHVAGAAKVLGVDVFPAAREVEDASNKARDWRKQICLAHALEIDAASDLEGFFQGLSKKILKRHNLNYSDRVIVVIDNLDRCDPIVMLRLIDALHQTTAAAGAGLDGVHFLLPLDPAAVVKAVQARYPDFSGDDARAYIEKIFWPIFRMPRLEKQVTQGILDKHPITQMLISHKATPAWARVTSKDITSVSNRILGSNPRKTLHLVQAAYALLRHYPKLNPFGDSESQQMVMPPNELVLVAVALCEFEQNAAKFIAESCDDVHDLLLAVQRGQGIKEHGITQANIIRLSNEPSIPRCTPFYQMVDKWPEIVEPLSGLGISPVPEQQNKRGWNASTFRMRWSAFAQILQTLLVHA